jgi:hypothetical protein
MFCALVHYADVGDMAVLLLLLRRRRLQQYFGCRLDRGDRGSA